MLVAGIGNLFQRDDGFGPEVVRRFAAAAEPLPGVRVVDYGIRGMHLAYDLLDGYAALVIVDAIPGTDPPGTIRVLAIGEQDLRGGSFDPHGMAPVAVLGSLTDLGGQLPPTYVVGCVPATTEEGIGLSAEVEAAVPAALDAVRTVLRDRVPQPAGHEQGGA